MDAPQDESDATPARWAELADWRRRISELYAQVRAAADPVASWWHWRSERDRLFQHHPQSPLSVIGKAAFKGLPYFDYDPRYRFHLALTSLDRPKSVQIDLGADGTISLQPFARTEGLAQALGGELTVYWIRGYGGGLFLPFSDASSGKETFGGGRYVLDSIKGADLGFAEGRLTVDFNFAYNPSCAHYPGWTCPLSPPENLLPVAIAAGEQTSD